MRIAIRDGAKTNNWNPFTKNLTASISIKDIGSTKTYIKNFDEFISNLDFKATTLESIEDIDFMIKISEQIPVNIPLYVFEDKYGDEYSGFRFAGEGNKLSIHLFKDIECSELVARRIFTSIILDFIKENKECVYYIQHEQLDSFTIYDGNKNKVSEEMSFEDTFKYIEGKG